MRRYPWQPCERPPPKAPFTLNNSVEYLPTQYLPRPIPQGGGRDGKSQGTNWHTNSKLLQQHFAKNFKQATAYISHDGAGTPPDDDCSSTLTALPRELLELGPGSISAANEAFTASTMVAMRVGSWRPAATTGAETTEDV